MIYISSGHIGTRSQLDHPRFCFHKWPVTITATNSTAGTSAFWMDDGETWSVWKAAASSVTVTLTFSETRAINYVGVAAHTLDVAGSTITLEVDDGSGFEALPGLAGIQPTDDSAILFLLGPLDVDAVRLVITGSAAPSIAVMQSGLSMELPRRAQYTALPISESEQIRYRTAQSVSGQVLGRAIEAAELSFQISIEHLSEDWRQEGGVTSWKAFTAHTRTSKPFFVASRPISYADDVAYGMAQDRPRFNRAIPNRRVSGQVAFDFLGYKRP